MDATLPLTTRRLEDLARARETVILVHRSRREPPVGALVLFPVDRAHLVKGAGPKALGGAWWAVTWRHGTWALTPVDPLAYREDPRGRPDTPHVLEPLDLTRIAREVPQPALEALAVAVHHGLAVTLWRRSSSGPEPRRLRAVKINPKRQVVVAEDLDRQAPRSFRLADVVAVELAEGQPVPTWDGTPGYTNPTPSR